MGLLEIPSKFASFFHILFFFLNIRLKINVVIMLLWMWRSPAESLRPKDFIPRRHLWAKVYGLLTFG